MEDNEAYSLTADYYYDIMHDSGLNTTEVVEVGKAALLNSVAQHFGLIDGARCSIPPVHALWLIDVASGISDTHESQFSKLWILLQALIIVSIMVLCSLTLTSFPI